MATAQGYAMKTGSSKLCRPLSCIFWYPLRCLQPYFARQNSRRSLRQLAFRGYVKVTWGGRQKRKGLETEGAQTVEAEGFESSFFYRFLKRLALLWPSEIALALLRGLQHSNWRVCVTFCTSMGLSSGAVTPKWKTLRKALICGCCRKPCFKLRAQLLAVAYSYFLLLDRRTTALRPATACPVLWSNLSICKLMFSNCGIRGDMLNPIVSHMNTPLSNQVYFWKVWSVTFN